MNNDIDANGAKLNMTLRQHKTGARIVSQTTGPSIIRYAVELDPGVKVERIVSLAKTLALATQCEEVRIIAPIPGTSYVGIEVPRLDRQVVPFTSTLAWLAQDDNADQLGPLAFPVGETVDGTMIFDDLTKMPHLLIAGATGSGKSVALNTLLCTLIARNDSDALELFLIDPKRVELAAYADAPQVRELVTNMTDAMSVLSELVAIMGDRYAHFADSGVRNIEEYNALKPLNSFALIVVVVDELADLVLVGGKDVEYSIVRLTQLARAAGIHLVLATQRPTVDVVTGLIKANVPSRWSFAVASGRDSMVVLDETGAQALTGKGDSLWRPQGQMHPQRAQAVFITGNEVNTIVAAAAEREQAKHPVIEEPGELEVEQVAQAESAKLDIASPADVVRAMLESSNALAAVTATPTLVDTSGGADQESWRAKIPEGYVALLDVEAIVTRRIAVAQRDFAAAQPEMMTMTDVHTMIAEGRRESEANMARANADALASLLTSPAPQPWGTVGLAPAHQAEVEQPPQQAMRLPLPKVMSLDMALALSVLLFLGVGLVSFILIPAAPVVIAGYAARKFYLAKVAERNARWDWPR